MYESSPSALETKADSLADQLIAPSVITKKTQTRSDKPIYDRTSSCCKRPDHGANRCNSNQHRDTKYPRCGKLGHSGKSGWAILGPGWSKTISFRALKTQADARMSAGPFQSGRNQVSVVTHENIAAEEELGASIKRIADGEPVPKT